jgi:hypothetical protein
MKNVLRSMKKERLPSLLPHKYPTWIKLFAGVLLLCVLYSLIFLPEYFIAIKKFQLGIVDYRNRNYSNAIRNFDYSLKIVPTSKKVKIAIAKAYFASNNPQDYEKGLYYLKDITLDKETWADLITVMPIEYQKYFNNTQL